MQYRTNSMAEGTFYTYLFEKNLQGDIIAIYNTSGTKLISYVYDAWGNFRQTNHNISGTNAGAQYNPFTYRGYYYDTELELYYLQSRYYDPFYGRFINADSYLSTGTGLLGYNMYVYCCNNPVSMIDENGNLPRKWIENAVNWFNEKIVHPVINFSKNIVKYFKNYDSNNENEEVVFSSNYFSNYKGTLVLKTPFDSSFSFGFIGLSRSQQNLNTLNHEYGHTIQMKNMGVGKYITDVAIPSVTINILSRAGKLKYDYYGAPWEAEADFLGGVSRTYGNTPWPEDAYTSYFDLIKMFWE